MQYGGNPVPGVHRCRWCSWLWMSCGLRRSLGWCCGAGCLVGANSSWFIRVAGVAGSRWRVACGGVLWVGAAVPRRREFVVVPAGLQMVLHRPELELLHFDLWKETGEFGQCDALVVSLAGW